MLGLYVSDHPLFGLEHVLSDKADAAHRPAHRRRATATARSSPSAASSPASSAR